MRLRRGEAASSCLLPFFTNIWLGSNARMSFTTHVGAFFEGPTLSLLLFPVAFHINALILIKK